MADKSGTGFMRAIVFAMGVTCLVAAFLITIMVAAYFVAYPTSWGLSVIVAMMVVPSFVGSLLIFMSWKDTVPSSRRLTEQQSSAETNTKTGSS